MKANELRIGNYVYFEDTLLKFDFESGWNFDYIKPILLTREWILNFNFQDKYSEKRIYFRIKGMLIEVKNGGKFYYNNIHLKYVHTLQNLYFALTSEELILQT